MIEHILAWLAGIIISVISATGYLGILILMAIESACIPLPSEVIMPFAGYLVSTGRFDLVLAATAGALGCNVGSIVAYRSEEHTSELQYLMRIPYAVFCLKTQNMI